jgi:3-oxoacyl-(acyl-carrier-protein) synthase
MGASILSAFVVTFERDDAKHMYCVVAESADAAFAVVKDTLEKSGLWIDEIGVSVCDITAHEHNNRIIFRSVIADIFDW